MQPIKHESLKSAEEVLKKLRVNRKQSEDFRVTCYENGREHGYCIKLFDAECVVHTICWSEARNSDLVVVYKSLPDERFDDAGNIPTERAYKSACYFSSVRDAADHINTVLREWMGA